MTSLKQRTNNRSNPSRKHSSSFHISHSGKDNFSKGKRKVNDDDEKENGRNVPRKPSGYSNQHRAVVNAKTTSKTQIDRDDATPSQTNTFDHLYCDIMYDNEYEGLHLAHFSACDIDFNEELQDSNVDSTSVPKAPIEMTTDFGKKEQMSVAGTLLSSIDCIILSSDDEASSDTVTSSSMAVVLPVYLLNQRR